MITEYEVGQIPAKPLGILVKDDMDNPVDMTVYATIGLEILGSDNEVIDLKDVNLHTVGARNGILAVAWPKNRSIFTKRGDYVLRIVLRNAEGSRDFTRAHTIKVREFGRVNN